MKKNRILAAIAERIVPAVVTLALIAGTFSTPILAQSEMPSEQSNIQTSDTNDTAKTNTDGQNTGDGEPSNTDQKPTDPGTGDGNTTTDPGTGDGNTTTDPGTGDGVTGGDNSTKPPPALPEVNNSNPGGGTTPDIKTPEPTFAPLEQPQVMNLLQNFALTSLDSFPSTNSANKASGFPYVEFVSATTNSVTLDFVNPKGGTYYFEYRIDGDIPDGRPINPNPCKESEPSIPTSCGGKRYLSDTEIAYPSYSVGPNQTNQVVIPATSKVEIRMTFGPERNYDFNWITFDVVAPPDTSIVQFVGSPKYVRANNGSDITAQIVTLESTTAVNFYIDGSSTPVPGYLHTGNAGAGKEWWRLATPLAPGEHTITAEVEIGGDWYDVNGTGIAYSLDTPWAEYVLPGIGQMFRPDDNVVRLKIDDEFDQFKEVRITLNGIVHTVLRNSCSDQGASVLCNLADLGLPAGVYSAVSTIYTKANNRLDNLPSEAFTIDGIQPMVLNLIVENAVGGVITNSAVLSAEASDDHGIESVNFYVTEPRSDGACTGNGNKLVSERVYTTGTDGKYHATLGVVGLDGEHCITAVSRDHSMHNSALVHQKVTITNAVADTEKPTAPTITFPTNGQVFPASPILNDWSDSTDASGIDKYEIEYVYSDGHTFAGGPYRETAGTVSQRNHQPSSGEQGGVTIRVRAYDNAGNVSDWSNSVYYIYDASGTHVSQIIEPTNGEVTSGTTDLIAYYQDQNGDGDDGVQWAVRQGTCTSGTGALVGNVGGQSDSAVWDGTNFSFALDTTALTNGSYCFVFNPSEDSGHIDQRLTRTFTVDNVVNGPSTETIEITGDTSTGENVLGWMFNRDKKTTSTFNFVAGNQSIGFGSLLADPILNNYDSLTFGTCKGSGNQADCSKFVGELFLLEPISEVNSVSYDFKIAAPNDTVWKQFYMNVYTNFGESSPTKFYDCRYDIVPTSGSTSDYSTVTFNLQTGAVTGGEVTNVQKRGDSPYDCPAAPADMDGLSSGSVIRAISISMGDTGSGDAGVSGYFDNVVVDTDSMVTTYDFEEAPAPVTPTITTTDTSQSRSAHSNPGRVLGVSTTGSVLGNACPLLTLPMRQGGVNDPAQVSSLQTFLNGELGLSLMVNGVFDTLTTNAVNAFQVKYASEVLAPWAPFGLEPNTPTGFVYKTTLWKINDIACPDMDVPFPAIP